VKSKLICLFSIAESSHGASRAPWVTRAHKVSGADTVPRFRGLIKPRLYRIGAIFRTSSLVIPILESDRGDPNLIDRRMLRRF